ncbi:MAG TPA: AAA family ATPase, partial [Anaerolineales bacterium]|nr:AAA family ATPase [Anaerolineales bacterium]
FLDGFSLPDALAFDEWLAFQRAAWGHRQNLVYDRLSLHQLETHLIQPAIETVIRWIMLDHLNEMAYQRLMRLHFLNGDRSAALHTYETCRDLLANELGVKPTPDTEELLAVIRLAQTPVPVAGPQTEARTPLQVPFVGRLHEYQGLVQSFRLAKKDKAQVVVLSGESGIGKTRLSEEFLKWAGAEGADVLRGRAFETSGRMPYQPFIDALRLRLERENAPDDLLDDAWLVELTSILPELRERYPDLPLPSSEPSTARARLFEAIARLAESLSARRPLVWLMDDLHWADKETLELLRYLSRHWQTSRAPILLLILIRGEALGHGSGLRNWMSGLAREIPITRFTLSAMSAEDLQQLITSLAGDNAQGSSEFAAWLTAETAGQPFFLSETLTALDEYGALIWRGESSARRLDPLATLANVKSMGPKSLAPAIRDIVSSRLEWLSQPAEVMLSAAAVIGRNCSFIRLRQVAGTDEQDSLNALDELLSARMILEVRDHARPYAISHDRIREVVYAQLSEARRQIFHRRALTALAEAKAPPAELAHHALAAQEWQFAFHHSLMAGDEAMRLYAVAAAAQHYETARTLLNQKKVEVETVTCQHLYVHLGQTYRLEFHHREALTVYEEMQAQASARGSRAMELAALVARCVMLPLPFDTQDVEQARALALQALPLAQALDDRKAQAQIELSLAWTHKYGDGKMEPTIAHFKAAEHLARKAGLPEQLGLVTLELGVAFISRGQLGQAESTLLESVEIFHELDDRSKLQAGLHNLAILHMETGRFDPALAFLQEASRANEALGSPTIMNSHALTRNVIHILRGEYDQALEALLPALEMDDTQIVSWLRDDIRQELAWCYYDLGAYDEGLIHSRNVINFQDHVNPMRKVPAFTLLALLQIGRGEFQEAVLAVKMGWENFDLQWQTYSGWWETLSLLAAEAELALAQGELARAAGCADQLLEKYEALNLRHLKPGVLYLRARIARAAGKREQAHQTLSDALALSDEMGAHREVWAMCAALGESEAERGNTSASAQWRERASIEARFIADHAGTPELRGIFLSRPEVQLILGA